MQGFSIRSLPRLLRLATWCALLLVLLLTGMRVAFWLLFEHSNDPLPTETLVHSFYIGLKFDIQLVLVLLAPMLLIGWLKPLSPFHYRTGRIFWKAYLAIVFLFTLLFYVTDFGYYSYLNTRVNATGFRFLENPLISAQMIWESYPVITVIVIILAVLFLFWKIVSFVLHRSLGSPAAGSRWAATALSVVFVAVYLFGIYGKLSWYPLRWSDAFFSTHPFAASLASNPVIYFANTLKRRTTYSVDKARVHYPQMVRYLGVDDPDSETLDYVRSRSFDNSGEPANVIIVLLESFASYKTGLSGNPLNPTPNFDRLAASGIYFNNFYVPSTGTARSIWTLVTGLPDVEEHKTSTRNPLIVDQHTLINAFSDREIYYFVGGSASWANIRGILSHNIPGLTMFEEGSYESPRVDVWGISDMNLFDESSKVLSNAHEPFFAIIQTAGNHRPYTIPEDNRGFESIALDEDRVRDYGFHSLAEYNSFRFMDHSIGEFMKNARKQSWFHDTLFVFFGDHGITNDAGKHSPKSENQLQMNSNRVPLVLFGPKFIPEPRRIAKVASEMDVLPTVAAMTQTSYVNTTLGRDLLDDRFDSQRFAYTITHDKGQELGLISDKYYLLMSNDGEKVRLHEIDSDTPRNDVSDRHPELTRQYRDILTSLNETAKYMRFHNSKRYSYERVSLHNRE